MYLLYYTFEQVFHSYVIGLALNLDEVAELIWIQSRHISQTYEEYITWGKLSILEIPKTSYQKLKSIGEKYDLPADGINVEEFYVEYWNAIFETEDPQLLSFDKNDCDIISKIILENENS